MQQPSSITAGKPQILISLLLIIIYSNTINSSWHFDDMQNIVENPDIQIDVLSTGTLVKSLFSNSGNPDKLYRPVACITFALNAFWGGSNVSGYHVVNIALHILTALILMKLMATIFKTPALKDTPENEQYFTIVLAALLWSVNPVQTQAVTYIVQRMAMLSAFFTLCSVLFYLKARISDEYIKKTAGYTASFLCFILSMLSKENGAVAPLLVISSEFILFRESSLSFLKNRYFMAFFLFFAVTATAVCHILGFNPFSIFNYSERTFTLTERILTQPRLLVYYLSQLFYPLPQRLSVEHDIALSTGLFSPPQTFLSLAAVFIMIASAVFIKKFNPLSRLAILFYFCGHIVESGLIPLEIMFEHRNYLPSALIFAPFGLFAFRYIKKYDTENKIFMKTSVSVFITSVIFLFSIGTYSRNFDWQTDETLWKDAAEKAPYSARPKHNLGFYYEQAGEYDKALLFYEESLRGFAHHIKYPASTLGNIGNIHAIKGEYVKAHQYWDRAIEINPELAEAYLAKTDAFIKEKKWGEALDILDFILKKVPGNFYANRFAAICYINTEKYQDALKHLQICLENRPDDRETILNIAEAVSLSGFPKRSDFFYRLYISKYHGDPAAYLGMAKNNYLNGDIQKTVRYLQIFFRLAGAENIDHFINDNNKKIFISAFKPEKMEDLVLKEFEYYKRSITIKNQTKNQADDIKQVISHHP